MEVVLLTISKHVCIYINIILSAITVNIILSDNNHQQFTLVWWKIWVNKIWWCLSVAINARI